MTYIQLLEQKMTLVLSNTRELNSIPSINYSSLYTIEYGLCAHYY